MRLKVHLFRRPPCLQDIAQNKTTKKSIALFRATFRRMWVACLFHDVGQLQIHLQQSQKFSHWNMEVSGFLSTSANSLIHKNCQREFLLAIWLNMTGNLKNGKRGQVTDTGLYPRLRIWEVSVSTISKAVLFSVFITALDSNPWRKYKYLAGKHWVK